MWDIVNPILCDETAKDRAPGLPHTNSEIAISRRISLNWPPLVVDVLPF